MTGVQTCALPILVAWIGGQVDEEQLCVPERGAAGAGARHGAQLHAAVPRRRRRPDRHQERLIGVTTLGFGVSARRGSAPSAR